MAESTSTHFTTTQDEANAGPFVVGTIQWLREFGQGDRPGLSAGYWYVTTEQAPETFPLVAEFDETFHLLTGRLRIEFVGGETVELVAGDSISYNQGADMRWTVLEDASKFFVYSPGGQA